MLEVFDHHRQPGVLEHLHAGAVGAFEHVDRQYLGRLAGADHALVEAHDVGQVSGHAVEIVGGQHDRPGLLG